MNSSRPLNRQTSFWVCAAIVMHTLWTSAAPVLTYPLYAAQWNLTPTVTTGIFAIYPAVVVATLLLFGNVSDYVGARVPMLLGLAASALGTLFLATATHLEWLFVGRVFMGVGVGLSAGPATASLVAFNPSERMSFSATVNAASQALGLGAAMLLGGALVQYAPFPTRLNFWFLLVVIMTIALAAWRLPRTATRKSFRSWRPGAVGIPRDILPTFLASALVVTTAYVLGAITLSLGGQIAKQVVGSSNAFINGAAISLFAICNGATTIGAGNVRVKRNITLGTVSSVAGLLLLMVAAHERSLAMFLASSTFTGIAYSMQFRGGLGLLVEAMSAEQRGATLSAIYLIAYLFQGAVALSLGVLATAHGLSTAVYAGAPVVAALSLAGLFLCSRLEPRISTAVSAK
ncbi:MFS transporter [Paraburkholderia sp. USG1]|uniref:MFS transporter n=1 Tax=Paraburkholderia sp. USG1 TaxID=2952268 RepID=UPI00286FF99E|nr:MFS transporter [Paraburkholderia sp. USG1]